MGRYAIHISLQGSGKGERRKRILQYFKDSCEPEQHSDDVWSVFYLGLPESLQLEIGELICKNEGDNALVMPLGHEGKVLRV